MTNAVRLAPKTEPAGISIVTFKWKAAPGYRSTFRAEHVNTLQRMVERHYHRPHRFICVTDDAEGIDTDKVEVVPLWPDHGQLKSPHGAGNPSCYRRLRLFARDAASLFGPRFVSLDLDCVVTGDLTPIFDRSESFLVWGLTNPHNPYNGSFMMLDAGARPQVWEKFDPIRSPIIAKQKGYFGSDQAWLCAVLGAGETRVGKPDGVYSYRIDIRPDRGRLPKDARLVFFHGQHDPWGPEPQRLAWVREHYR